MSHNVWFTSDPHFDSNNIIERCNRPFSCKEEMNAAMIDRTREVVRAGDRVYNLGDVANTSFEVAQYFGNINSKEIHQIWGNHDRPQLIKHKYIRSYSDIKRINVGGIHLVLCHYAMRSWQGKGRGAYMLYGHSHGKLPGQGRSMDVGVDTNNFYPYNLDEIVAKLKDQPFYQEEE